MGVFRFFRRAQWDDERANELADYLARERDDNIARGMTLDEAAHAARRKLGNPTRIREEIYEMNTMPFFDALWQDLRYGMRLLRRNPTFALVGVLTLALGTGANAAIFQLVNALRLRSLPVAQPHELVSIRIDQHSTGRVGRGLAGGVFTEPLWQEIRSQQQAVSPLFAWGADRWDLSSAGEVALA
ncbi:MAG: multidrug ABC transporter substrate-binding protein, partial [Acidobacteria bacterium]